SAFLYVGQANRRYFQHHRVKEDRLFFAPHAVDNDRFFAQSSAATEQGVAWRRKLGGPEKHRVILFAGKFEEKKRPLDLLEAFKRAAVPDVTLVFVGNGELEAKLKSKAAAFKNVFFISFQNQTAMPAVYRIGDIFVLPSFGPRETW